MRMLASQENVSDTKLLGVADTRLSLGTETLAPNPAPQPLSTPPPAFHLFSYFIQRTRHRHTVRREVNT